jgi:hypothetical protein
LSALGLELFLQLEERLEYSLREGLKNLVYCQQEEQNCLGYSQQEEHSYLEYSLREGLKNLVYCQQEEQQKQKSLLASQPIQLTKLISYSSYCFS